MAGFKRKLASRGGLVAVLLLALMVGTAYALIRGVNMEEGTGSASFGTWAPAAGTINLTSFGAFLVPSGTATAPTTEGSVYWQSTNDNLTVGDGSAAQTMVRLAGTQTLSGNKTLSGTTTVSGTMTITGTLNNNGGAWVAPVANSPAQTASGSLVYDGDDSLLTVGTGNGTRVTLVNQTNTQTISGIKTFSGANTHSGANTFSSTNSFSALMTKTGGTVTASNAVTSNTTATSAMLGELVVLGNAGDAGDTLTLPTPTAGYNLVVVLGDTSFNGHAVQVPSGNLRGNGYGTVTRAVCTGATDRVGDALNLWSNGTDWYITAVTGTWAGQ